MAKHNAKTLRDADGGYASRKLWYAMGTSFLIFVGAILSGVWKLFGPHYETMISGLIGVLAVYMGGNVTGKLAVGKAASYGFGGVDANGSYGGGYGYPGYAAPAAVLPYNVPVPPQPPKPTPPVEPIPSPPPSDFCNRTTPIMAVTTMR